MEVYSTRRDIQVLRGFSVIAVVLFHFYPHIFPRGYLGVDIFFVISGYLLVPKMLEIGSKSDESLSKFFLKRFARLTPALCITIAFFSTWIVLFGPLEEQRFAFAQAITAVLNLSNVQAFRLSQGNYFNPNPNGLLHTWSLSVEQQLYFAIPLVLILFTSIRKKIVFLKLLLVILSLYFFMMKFTTINFFPLEILNNREFYYFSPLFRGFEFLLGAMIRIHFDRRNKGFLQQRYLWPLLLVVTIMKIPEEIGLAGVLLLSSLILAKPTTPIKIFNSFERMGDSSYSIYLIHLPVVYIFSYYFQSIGLFHFLGAISLILFLSEVSRKYIEVKFRDFFLEKSKSAQVKMAFSFSLTTLILLAVLRIGSVNYYWVGVPPTLGGTINCDQGDYGNCGHPSSTERNFLLIGDSHAAAIADTFKSVFSQTSNAIVMYGRGCPLKYESTVSKEVTSSCDEYMNNVFEMLQKYKFDVIVSQRSSLVSENAPAYNRDLLSAVRKISIMAENVYLISPNYELREGQSQGKTIDLSKPDICVDISDLNPTPRNDYRYLVNNVVSKNVTVIDSAEFFSGNDCHFIKRNNQYLYWDSNHLSTAGADFYSRIFKRILLERS